MEEVIFSAFFILLIAVLFDGVKLFIESLFRKELLTGKPDKFNTTAIISAYNEEDLIQETIESLSSNIHKFIIINDTSTDKTRDIILSMGNLLWKEEREDIIIYSIKSTSRDIEIKLIDNKVNKGKVLSIHESLRFIDTKYIFVADADIFVYDDFNIPATILQKHGDEIDALSFMVIPFVIGNTVINKILYNLQLHEYLKTMNIGKQFADRTKSVECISGASGLFKSERLKELVNYHSGEWQGEDLERTLIELYYDGGIAFTDELIMTEAPQKFYDLYKQRVYVWWGGLLRNLSFFISMVLKKNAPFRLRYEMFYNIISVLLDPLKFISLYILVFTFNVEILGVLYLIYFSFELYLYFKVKDNRYDFSSTWYTPFLYPLYGILQLHFRIFGFIYILFGRVSGKVKGLKYKRKN